MCNRSLFVQDQHEGQEWLAPIQEEGGASFTTAAAAEDDGEWDTVEARGGRDSNSSEDGDRQDWEILASPTSWAAVAGNSSFGGSVVVWNAAARQSPRPHKEREGRQGRNEKAGAEGDECGIDECGKRTRSPEDKAKRCLPSKKA